MKAKIEEKQLKDLGIIEEVPHDQPITWCTNPVIAPKPRNPDEIRYCSDMQVSNTAIKRPVTEVPTVSDIRFKLEGAKVFSVLDMNEGYHQILLDKESRHLTAFHGTQQKMRYTRLNFGTISAQDIFDKAMDDTIDDLNGVLHIRDDFIVYGRSNKEHDEALESLLQRFRECGLTYNPNALSSDAVIGYYEIGRETKLKVDAGPNGLGVILLQKKEENRWQRVECASRSLTEKWYLQLEKEALAVRWAYERCYMYLIGSTFVVETDHKALLPLFNNPNSFLPLRIE